VKLEGEAKLKKIPKQEYTPEFRELAVKRVKAGQSNGAVARELGLSSPLQKFAHVLSGRQF
jgi:transposase